MSVLKQQTNRMNLGAGLESQVFILATLTNPIEYENTVYF